MKKAAMASIGLLVIIFYINGCGIINREADSSLENDPSAFHTQDHQKGEVFGFWNQQKDKNNPIANKVTRDERLGRGSEAQIAPNRSGFDNISHSRRDQGNLREQITLELINWDTVRDVRVIAYRNELLIAVDNEAKDTKALKSEIISYLENNFPTKEVTVVTDRRTVDRISLLENGFQGGVFSEDYGIELRRFFKN